MNKARKFLLVFVMTVIAFTGLKVFAATTTIFRLTSNTYINSTHGDDYFDDQYLGELYIRGADRIWMSSYTAYPYQLRITYDVQGRIYQKQIQSQGQNDTVVRYGSIVVTDLWNVGPKTQVYGNWTPGTASTNLIQSSETTE